MSIILLGSYVAILMYESRVDAARYGITTLAPKFFGSKPDLVVSGPNVGCKSMVLHATMFVDSSDG